MTEERVPGSVLALTGPAADEAPTVLRRFVGHLAAGCGRVRERAASSGVDLSALDERIQSLALAEAAIRYGGLVADEATRPFHVAVLGPTQTGKSTLVNLLLSCRAAEVSPLAGFTVHPQGFWISRGQQNTEWAAGLFPGWQRRALGELKRDELEAYALTRVEPACGMPTNGGRHGPVACRPTAVGMAHAALPPCVVWDTPDFDSLAARHYARGVLEVVALADLYVLVLSKEKYSDLSVWRMLALLEPLRRPLVICVNKLTPDAVDPIVHSLRERLAERGQAWGEVPIIPLLYNPLFAAGGWFESPALAPRSISNFKSQISEGTVLSAGADGHDRVGPTQRATGVRALLRRHWDTWLAPLRAEHEALAEWERTVQAAGTKFMAAYARDYLDHPQRYDSFRRAAIELLNLLEIPGVSGIMARARQAVTWPVRQIIAAGRAWWDDRPARGRGRDTIHSLGAEATVLLDTLEALLTELQRDVARRCARANPGGAVWQALERKLDAEQARLRKVFEAAVLAHHEQVSSELRAAANRLYVELQKRPARLAALRTARATIDVGSLLLAVKTGGLTLLDAVWAPATFAATSLLIEGVAGAEMAREARRLKTRQRAAVREGFVDKILVGELAALADDLDPAGLFATTPDEVRAATEALETWEGRR